MIIDVTWSLTNFDRLSRRINASPLFVLSLSIFGASTFAVIVSQIANPSDLTANPRFTQDSVRTFLGISWLLFILALGVVALSMSALAFQRERPRADSMALERIYGNVWDFLLRL